MYVLVADTKAPDAGGSLEREEIEGDFSSRLESLSGGLYDVVVAPTRDSASILCKAVGECDVVLLEEGPSSDRQGIVLKVTVIDRRLTKKHSKVQIPEPPPEKTCAMDPTDVENWALCRPRFFNSYVKEIVKHHIARHQQ